MDYLPKESRRFGGVQNPLELAGYLEFLKRDDDSVFAFWYGILKTHPEACSLLDEVEAAQRQLAFLYPLDVSVQNRDRAIRCLDRAVQARETEVEWDDNAAACAAIAARRSRETANRNPALALYWSRMARAAAATLSLAEDEQVVRGNLSNPKIETKDCRDRRDGHALIQFRALLAEANAERVNGNPRTAARLLDETDELLCLSGLLAKDVLDDLYDQASVQISTLIDLGLFDKALELVPRALKLAATDEERGRVQWKTGRLFAESGRPAEAIRRYLEALKLIPGAESSPHPDITVSIANNLVDLGRIGEAQEWLKKTLAPSGSILEFRKTTVQARIAAAEQDQTVARNLFLATVHGFLEHGAHALAALALLDMARDCQSHQAEILAAAGQLLQQTELQEHIRLTVGLMQRHIKEDTLSVTVAAVLRNRLATRQPPVASQSVRLSASARSSGTRSSGT